MSGHPLRGNLGGRGGGSGDGNDGDGDAPKKKPVIIGGKQPVIKRTASAEDDHPLAPNLRGSSESEEAAEEAPFELESDMQVENDETPVEVEEASTDDDMSFDETPEAEPEPEPAYEPEPEPVYEEAASDSQEWVYEPTEDVPASPGGRKVLAALLSILSLAWLGYAGWSAGRALSSTSLLSPDIAIWVAVACAPLALFALVWMMFGRTRRKEAEAFTHQVALMRAEADALTHRLFMMSDNLGQNRSRLGELAGELEGRADQAAERLRAIGVDLESGAERLAHHGSSLDATASSARADMAALLEAMPEAEEKLGSLSASLQGASSSVVEDTQKLESAIASLGARANESETRMREAGEGLNQQLTALDAAGEKALGKIDQANRTTGDLVDSLLARTAASLEEIRNGISTQSQAIDALINRAQSGIDQTGSGAAAQLSARITEADGALTKLGERISEHDERARVMIADIDSGIGVLEERFGKLAEDGDSRAQTIAASLQVVRDQIAATNAESSAQDNMVEALSTRTQGIRETLTGLSHFLNQQLAGDIGGAQDALDRLTSASDRIGPVITTVRDQAVEAGEKVEGTASRIESSRETLATLMEGLEGGVGDAEKRLAELQQSISILQDDAKSLTVETAPQLVDAMMQVREAGQRAAENARAAIAEAIPEGAARLGKESREAVQKAVEEAILAQLQELDAVSTRAIEAARGASDRLSAQMLSIGQTASALEAHMEEINETNRETESERFASQAALLMESMNSAAIDVEKVLSNEVDEKSWQAYLKGERGVFTRKAVRLLSTSEARELGSVYDEDGEFRTATNRFVHDFEAMLRRVMAERDGAMMGVTLMSSDMGKLYAALAQVIDRKAAR
ncbi:hypothetical protein [Sphingomicrobium sediminis]|uniref:ATPase n=1 Tax=Sphingomicrobium sediminis TaxID=2950949 RepID=A0A9X2EFJ2_9SPHN|nr:hypothetical protein [Sphingomicrobium sediminis]MCM8557013.1 hypothetical protein [Sphingomicrobium sediminis]